jgi:hypothetical protein
MTQQVSGNRSGWRRAMAAAVIATGLMAGFGPGVASADVLDDIAAQYRSGEGGGQVSKLIDDALSLRAQGFRPSRGNMVALQDGLQKRPNQTALITALKETVNFQRKTKARTGIW